MKEIKRKRRSHQRVLGHELMSSLSGSQVGKFRIDIQLKKKRIGQRTEAKATREWKTIGLLVSTHFSGSLQAHKP